MTEATTPLGPVLVGVDGSDPAMSAVLWAAATAARRAAPLRVLHAFGWMPVVRAGVNAGYGEVLLHTAHDLVAAAVAHAQHVAPDVRVSGEVLPGYPIPRLIAESRNAQLVVVGDRGIGGIGGMLVGSVAVALAAHAFCPAVVVRGPEPEPSAASSRPVLVGVGEPADSAAAVRFAFEEAAARGAPLVAVHAWSCPALLYPDAAALVDWEAVAAEEGRVLADSISTWGQRYPGVRVEQVVRKGLPARELLQRSTDAQLVVVGAGGQGGMTGTLLGSVGHALLHHSTCPVAVVRPTWPH